MTLILSPRIPGRVDEPGTPGNWVDIAVPAWPADPSVETRFDIDVPPLPPTTPVFRRPVSNPMYLTIFSSGTYFVQQNNTDASVTQASIAAGPLAALGYPAPSTRIQGKIAWDATTDTISFHWRPHQEDFYDDSHWILCCSAVGAGKQLAYQAIFRLGGASTDPMEGNIYRVLRKVNGVNEIEVDFDADITDLSVTAFTTKSGHAATVIRSDRISGIWTPGSAGNYFSAPHAANLDIVGDITLAWGFIPDVWPATTGWMGKGTAESAGTMAYRLRPGGTGTVSLTIDSPVGLQTHASPVLPGVQPNAPYYVAVALDVDNGAGGRTHQWFTSPDGWNWTALAAPTTMGATTSINTSAAALNMNGLPSGSNMFAGQTIMFAIRNGIGGTGVFGGTEIFRFDRNSTKRQGSAVYQVATGQLLTVVGSEVRLEGDPLVFLDEIPETFTNVIPIRERVLPSIWSLDLCRSWIRVASCDAFDFSGVTRRLDGGEFSLKTSPRGVSGGVYAWPDGLGGYGVLGFDPRDVDTFRLVAEGQPVFSGILRGDDDQFRIIQDKDGVSWEWTGSDPWIYLDRRLAYPDPLVEPPWGVAHDTRTGIASNVLGGYLQANMGALATASRTWGGFLSIEDQSVGADYTFSARLQTMKELAKRIGRDASIEVTLQVDFNGQLRILLSEARNLSSVLVLSDQGDLAESEYMLTPTRANFIVSAGQGELTARTFRTSGGTGTGPLRFEKLSDQSNMASSSELQADADSKRLMNEESYAIVSELTDYQAKLALQFGLRLGDVLGVIVQGRRYDVPIEQFTFEVNPERQILRPIFGTAIPGRLAALLKKLERAGRRIGNDDMVA